MADPTQGDALFRADSALAALHYDPHPRQAEYYRGQYSASPPSYRSRSSLDSTRSESVPGDEEQRHEEQELQLMLDRRASSPYFQFEAQMGEEEDRIFKADGRWRPGEIKPSDIRVTALARETVKRRWVEQGIWNDKWDEHRNMRRWKHEEALELVLESQMEKDPCAKHVFLGQRDIRPKTNDDLQLIAERRRKEGRKREASRPFHQFMYQLSKERERMQDDSRPGGPDLDTVDINTKAYDIVRGIWTRRGIWDTKWGILPGMSWKHERPLDHLLPEEMVPESPRQVHPPEGDGGGAYPAPRRIFGPRPPAKSNNSAVSDLPEMSQQPPTPQGILRPPRPADLNSAIAGVSDVSQQQPPAVSGEAGLQDAWSVTGQRSRRGNRAPSPREGRAAGTALGLARPAKVSKPPHKKKGSDSRRRETSKASLKNAQPPPPTQDLPKPCPVTSVPKQPPLPPPRRSRRLQKLKSTEASTGPAAVNPATSVAKGVSQSRPRRTTGGSPKSLASAKPQGISKRQHPSTGRRRKPNQARVPA
ncbi:hypothetical protein VPNG_06403 [Cytospora leucostoma]|uniref:Uncharacterized protein n=1 Tax=Cytospora leucostoma TaxID=1230097 RepID=A0A423WYX8_9PEZI|nr:hypothetical protein VPNG_06403 [Cytospora leucostoma]